MGGSGVVIEIDESQLHHKPKHHRGRGSTMWVFGMVDISTTPSIGIMKVVPDRSAATLLPIIHDNIRHGSIIHSDQWAAYTRLRSDPRYDYRSVNHSLHFVDPVAGVHTQTIESYCAKVKLPIKSMKGVHMGQLNSYLDERMWRHRLGSNAFENICSHIASQYPSKLFCLGLQVIFQIHISEIKKKKNARLYIYICININIYINILFGTECQKLFYRGKQVQYLFLIIKYVHSNTQYR